MIGRVRELEEEVQRYRELLKEENYVEERRKKKQVMTESLEVQEYGSYKTASINNIPGVSESQPPKYPSFSDSSNPFTAQFIKPPSL